MDGKEISFIHVSDLHCNKKRKNECMEVLSRIRDFVASKEVPPKVLFAGDFWDSAITNTTVFSEYVAVMNSLIRLTEVFMIYGTASHEPEDSLEVFAELGAHVYRHVSFESFDDFELVAIPEPRKADFCESGKSLGDEVQKMIDGFISGLPAKEKIRMALFHGEIIGVKYPNGMSCSSELAVRKSQLKKLDADYIACGHIHNDIKVSENCFYAGSVPAVKIDEEHDAGFYFISFEDGKRKVERISLGFPTNMTERIKFEELDSLLKKDYTNKKVRVCVSLEKTLKKTFREEVIRQNIKTATGAVSVRFSWEYKAVTNIRSKEISEKKSVVDKFKAYAAANKINCGESVVGELADIQEHISDEIFVPSEALTLESLDLRGAIGIKDGTGKDEIFIDFSKYTGILCIIGDNGTGKTTILESCHPFPQMLTRQGTLREHFFLKDSHRILVYKSTSGRRYRISILIDASGKKTGSAAYFVDVKEAGAQSWSRIPSVNGGLDSYKEWVFQHFGTVDMFMRTSFFAKEQVKSIPDLSRMTKADKMELFSVLTGIEYLSEIKKAAKIKADEIQDRIKEIKSSWADFDEIKMRLDTLGNRKVNITGRISELEAELKKDKEELSFYRTEQEKFIAVAGSLSAIRTSMKAQAELSDSLSKELVALEHRADELSGLLVNKKYYAEQLDWWDESCKKKEQLEEVVSSRQSLIASESAKLTVMETKLNEINMATEGLSKKIAADRAKMEALLSSVVEDSRLCPICGAVMSEAKMAEVSRNNGMIRKEAGRLSKEIKINEEQLDARKKEAECFSLQPVIKNIDSLRAESREAQLDIDTINRYMKEVDRELAEFVTFRADDEYTDIIFKKKEISEKKSGIDAELKKLRESIDNQPKDWSDKIRRLERGIQNMNKERSELDGEMRSIAEQLLFMEKQKSAVSTADAEIRKLENEKDEFQVLEKAFGNNGIQAVELDSAAPEISDVANSILRETYGDRFSISFETQREASDGRKLDDFIINVFDSESGRKKKLDTLCSGELVWIKQALYFSFSVLRARKTGFCFRTRFLDESDGSLDSEARGKYIKMIEAAHKACGAVLTIMITHSQEVKELVSQKIQLGKD